MDRKTAISTIRALSLFLSKYGGGYPPRDDRNESNGLSLLKHISTILNTGMPHSLVSAVTGHISPKNFCAVVVVSSIQYTTDRVHLPYDITKVEPSPDESILRPSSLGKPDGPPFQQHLCDIAGILRLLTQTPDPVKLYTRFLFWLIVQCRKRIAIRFNVVAATWTPSPWKIIEDWSPNAKEVFASPRIDIPESFREELPELGFPNHDDGVHLWIKCLGRLLSAAHELRDENDEESLEALQNYLICIDTILKCRQVQDAFHKTRSLSAAFSGNKNYRFISSDVSTADDADDTSEAAAAEFDQFQSESEWNEGSGSCALRYLLTLVAWHTAARAVIKLSRIANRIGKLPEVFLVRLAEYSSHALDDVRTNSRAIVDSLKAEVTPEYVDRPKAKEIILRSIERRCEVPRIIRPFRVHPEAGLMALLMKAEVEPIYYLGHERTYQSTTDFFSEAENCAIGVNKMCCRTCNLLGECMSNELSKTVRLPRTHGQVLPWDPPSFGMPDTILQTLAQNLRKEMISLATSDIQMMEIWEEDDEIIFEARCITRTPEE